MAKVEKLIGVIKVMLDAYTEKRIDRLSLARRKFCFRIEAREIIEQALAAQDFMDAGDAAGETVTGIKNRGVGIGQRGAFVHQ